MIPFNIYETRDYFHKKKHQWRWLDKVWPPDWLRKDRRTDPLIHLYLRQKEFYQQGDVYLGCIVQANEFLFDPQNRWNCPAAVLYTQDDYYYQHPEELAQLAHNLYSVKGETGYVENVQMFADMLANELDREFAVLVPFEFTENRRVYFTTLMVHRRHIPGGCLSQPFYPILAIEHGRPDAMIVPKRYWISS